MPDVVSPSDVVPVVVATALPVAQAFAIAEPVAVPEGWGPYMSPQVWGVLAASQSLTIRQHVKWLPKNCCSCPPCVKQENTYSIYAGIGQDSRAELFRADEISDDWNRCCCAPHHPVKVVIKQYIPNATDMGGQTDWQNTVNEISMDWQNFTDKKDRAKAEKAAYGHVPVAFTMIRDGTQYPACCNKCVGCCIFTDCCADGMTMVAGPTSESSTKEIGATLINNLDPNMTIGSAKVPVMSAFFSPTLHVMERGGMDGPFAKVEGPCLFGGCSDFCCSFNFPVSRMDSPAKSGDLGKIIKQKPKNFGAAAREVLSSADLYTLEFGDDKSLTPEQKALLIGSLILNDYTYFEGPQDACGVDPEDGQCYIKLFNCYCCGVLWPCKIKPPKSGE